MEDTGKLYYGIKEVADRFQINASKLRFYEKEFPMLQPKKNRSGDRVYTQADIDLLAEILDLINQQKYTLPGAREFLTNRENRRRENTKYIAKLTKLKKFLEKMRSDLDKPREAPQAKETDDADAQNLSRSPIQSVGES